MNKLPFLLMLLFAPLTLVSQNENNSFLEFSFGRSIHGTGDTFGYHYGFNYGQKFSKKFYWQIGFEGTLNDSPDFFLTYEDPQGNVFDGTLHTVTAGYQFVSGIRYNFIESGHHRFGISILSIFRYQATSLSDTTGTLFPAATNFPIPVRVITRLSSGRTFAVGGSLRLQYSYQLGNMCYIGILGAFQTDSNGDTIPHYSLTFTKAF